MGKYIPPDEFEELVDNGELFRVGLTILNDDIYFAEKCIDAIRPLNKQDPGFTYSCECKSNINGTTWLFGYTNHEIKENVEELLKNMIITERLELGVENPEEDLYSSFAHGTPCSCPFRSD